jgi:hypothetical protein
LGTAWFNESTGNQSHDIFARRKNVGCGVAYQPAHPAGLPVLFNDHCPKIPVSKEVRAVLCVEHPVFDQPAVCFIFYLLAYPEIFAVSPGAILLYIH